ncbi:N-acetylmuramoyl-L-alanine amidase AmiD [Roseibium sp. TrichSKD4]|uniref:N-acetylmuramoyl-L-alanine amidase n=1 Tax=Roseibium sp. TrichSKD4 TaxID=744980 RepID=UPI0001E5697E|nr:N-acetylmuramoyl-L-alanine amidase [Roseibium sp. TrichSKD4]EFO31062.1 N-acetylmuramoyl-L-alanine amidase AmiD [Roseibium sp. TrichSKD4]
MSAKTDTGVPARLRPSPNHGERVGGGSIDMLILHYTGMETAEAALQRLCDPRAEVSAHYVVEEGGSILQCVPEARRAWHAGRSYWKGTTDINSRSIGIEIVNRGYDYDYPEFPDVQIEAVCDLCADIVERHEIKPWRVLAHSDIAPDRKLDPGEKFPWGRLAAKGVGLYVEPEVTGRGIFMQEGESGQPVEALQSMLAIFGYRMEVTGQFDATTRLAVEAFQRHYRPEQVDGIVDQSTIETLHKLLSKLPDLNA